MIRQNHLYQLHSGFKVHSNSAQTNRLLKPLAQEISSSTCISCKVVSKSIQTQLKLHASWSECDHNCAGTVTSTRTRSTRYHYKSFETKLLVNSSSTPTYSKVFTKFRFTSCGWQRIWRVPPSPPLRIFFSKKGVTDLGGPPAPPFTDKIRKVVFEVLPKPML